MSIFDDSLFFFSLCIRSMLFRLLLPFLRLSFSICQPLDKVVKSFSMLIFFYLATELEGAAALRGNEISQHTEKEGKAGMIKLKKNLKFQFCIYAEETRTREELELASIDAAWISLRVICLLNYHREVDSTDSWLSLRLISRREKIFSVLHDRTARETWIRQRRGTILSSSVKPFLEMLNQTAIRSESLRFHCSKQSSYKKTRWFVLLYFSFSREREMKWNKRKIFIARHNSPGLSCSVWDN